MCNPRRRVDRRRPVAPGLPGTVSRAAGARVAVAAVLLGSATGSLHAQGPDSAHAHATPTPAAHAPGYPLAPTPVLDLHSLGARIALSGYISARLTHHNDSTAMVVNRARLTAQIAPLPYMGVRLQADFSSGQTGRTRADSSVAGFTLTDGYAELAAPTSRPGTVADLRPALIAGQFKAPFSLEYLTPFSILKTVDRSQAVDSLAIKRDIGVLGHVGWRHWASLAAAVLNGAGPNATANPDNQLLAVSRLTLTPVSFAELSIKVSDQGSDHAWGYDGRLLWRDLTVEGETVFREWPTSPTTRVDAGGGYALIAFRVLRWLEPVYKYDRYWDTSFTTEDGSVTSATNRTWNVVGVNLRSVPEWLRLQLDWELRNERPTPGRTNWLVAQVVAIF